MKSDCHILIIDDNDLLLDLLEAVLQEEGCRVTTARDGVRGMEAFREHGPDLVVTDLIMPEKEGLETIMEIKRMNPDARIIAMSGGSPKVEKEILLQTAELLGSRQVLRKPFSNALFLETVRAALA